MKFLLPIFLPMILIGCAMAPPKDDAPKQTILIHKQTTTLLEGCKRLGPVATETYGNIFNFDSLAENTFKELAVSKYGPDVDNIALVNKELLPAGHVIMQGIAYSCFK